MINIGIDFGSTYTMVSKYYDDIPATIQPDGLTYNYPSIVVYDKSKDTYSFGSNARKRMGNRNTVTFRGFKMLLNQQMSPENLKKRGYDDVNTPEYITSLFLRYVIENTLHREGEDKVDTLVVGAPECWFQSYDTVDARAALRKICSSMSDIVDKVKIISEPTNAAAFSVWNYGREMNNKQLEGKILVVDYGGGTLDTALVEVRHQSSGLQLKPEIRSGAGENHDQEIGSAGIAYQEAVARLAISEQLGISPEEIPYDLAFNKFLKDFEEFLISGKDDIREVMDEFQFSVEDMKDQLFEEIDYGSETISVTFYHLYDAYHRVIAPVLERVLKETSVDINSDEKIHISLVGGFCNFCLVQKQIYDYFSISERDERVKGMIREEAEREKAIAHGASLFASGEISVCNVANFSIGTYAVYANGERFNRYAINIGQEIEADTVYFALDDNGMPYPMTSGDIDKFLINFTRSDAHAMDMKPKPNFARRLKEIQCGYVVVIGFSLDVEEQITVHVYNYDLETGAVDEEPVDSVHLSTIKGMFGSIVLTNIGG